MNQTPKIPDPKFRPPGLKSSILLTPIAMPLAGTFANTPEELRSILIYAFSDSLMTLQVAYQTNGRHPESFLTEDYNKAAETVLNNLIKYSAEQVAEHFCPIPDVSPKNFN